MADAQTLPFRRGRFAVLVAEHLVDLLEAPEAFFESALAVLRPGGRALVTTPEPSLGGDDDGRVEALARAADFTVAARSEVWRPGSDQAEPGAAAPDEQAPWPRDPRLVLAARQLRLQRQRVTSQLEALGVGDGEHLASAR